MDMCAKPADANLLIRTGGIRVEQIRIGGIRFEWICVGYAWCDGYVWDMCGVRYANNLLKNPATKRLSGKNPSSLRWKSGHALFSTFFLLSCACYLTVLQHACSRFCPRALDWLTFCMATP